MFIFAVDSPCDHHQATTIIDLEKTCLMSLMSMTSERQDLPVYSSIKELFLQDTEDSVKK
jgi:hypothetical protein